MTFLRQPATRQMPVPRTITIIACESSGDNYGALLARELKAKEPDLRIIGLGGPKMVDAGVEVLVNMIDHAAMGLAEVLGSIRFFLDAMHTIVDTSIDAGSDAVVMIDSPDFNLRIAKHFKRASIPVLYYVSPQLWAWRASRIKQVQMYVDAMICLFPFEVEWYAERGVEAHFCGHPIFDVIDFEGATNRGAALKSSLCQDGETLIGILPGSRGMEVRNLLPRFLASAAKLETLTDQKLRFAVGCSHWLTEERTRPLMPRYMPSNVEFLHHQTHDLMAASDLLYCCSGTATLESALFGTPMLMSYQLKWLTYFFVMAFIFNRETLFSLPNIILKRQVVPEMLQWLGEPTTMALTAKDILNNNGRDQREAFSELRNLLGGPGASARVADKVLELMETR